MSTVPAVPYEWEPVNNVAVIRILCRELNNPHLAKELGTQLQVFLTSGPTKRFVINFQKTNIMSSTAFATLVAFGKRVAEVNGRVAVCALDPNLRLGADIIGLAQIIPIYDSEAEAVRAVAAPAGET
jgi:anti-sigma B factor antagonist